MKSLKYSQIADAIDMDLFEEAIEFEPMSSKGPEDMGKCPDYWQMHKHGDTTGKFSINRDKKLFHCFVCGGGSLLALAMAFLDTDEDEVAIDWLRQFTRGDTRSDIEFLDEFMKMFDEYKERKADKMPYFNELVLGRFTDETDWFKRRGISDEVAERHHLGYSKYAMKAGPTKAEGKLDNYYGPCAVFPHYWEGRLVGWQHRWMDWDRDHTQTPKWLPKYTNTSDFPKHETLYNFDEAIKRREPVFVVESVPTVLFLESLGLNSVSPFGSDIKPKQLRYLRRFQSGVFICPDNDEPGDKLATVASEYLEKFVDVKVLPKVTHKKGADLNDLLDKHSIDEIPDVLDDFIDRAKSPSLL